MFLLTLIDDGTLGEALALPWLLLWLVALLGMLPGLVSLVVDRFRVPARPAVAAERVLFWAVAPSLVLAGVLALRAVVIFSAQA